MVSVEMDMVPFQRWLVRAVVAADLMRLVAPALACSFLYPDAPIFLLKKKNACAELTDVRNFFLRACSRSIGSVTRFLESFSPPFFGQGRATGKRLSSWWLKIMLGLLASAMACFFSSGVYSRLKLVLNFLLYSFDWSWIWLSASRS